MYRTVDVELTNLKCHMIVIILHDIASVSEKTALLQVLYFTGYIYFIHVPKLLSCAVCMQLQKMVNLCISTLTVEKCFSKFMYFLTQCRKMFQYKAFFTQMLNFRVYFISGHNVLQLHNKYSIQCLMRAPLLYNRLITLNK